MSKVAGIRSSFPLSSNRISSNNIQHIIDRVIVCMCICTSGGVVYTVGGEKKKGVASESGVYIRNNMIIKKNNKA